MGTSEGQSRNFVPGFTNYSYMYQSDAADNFVTHVSGGQTYNADNQFARDGLQRQRQHARLHIRRERSHYRLCGRNDGGLPRRRLAGMEAGDGERRLSGADVLASTGER